MFKKKTPEELAAQEASRRAADEQREVDRRRAEEEKRAQAFAKTPAGQAQAAKFAGEKIFQIALPLSRTHANVVAMVGAFTSKMDSEHASALGSIETQGWRLEHAGYVFRVTGSESRDKFLSSGQQEAVSGEIIGVYIFRLSEHDIVSE